MYDWWVGDNVQSILNSGTQEVGGGECAINNVFLSGFGIPAGSTCTNKYQFYRYGDNRLVLKITGTVRCNGSNAADKRRSSITTKITVFRADTLMVFETFPTDTLPDVFFENNLSFPIDNKGNHLSNGASGDVSQNIGSGIAGEFDTGFFNCFSFGNGVESYKVRDSLIGRTFNLGERVTTVSAQDYKEARRFADITYSGVYNQETNVNKLNEFNLGLLNFKNLEVSFGDIQILDGRETDVLTLQEDKISYVLAGKNLLSDAAAGSALTSVPEVLGTQIARVEKYGISFNPESYVQWGYDRFFTDVKRGAVIQMKGDSMSQDQLAVISEANMRTWFRDEFINSFSTQKLGGYDPYMNEYVLSTNDRLLPQNNLCAECGVTQVFAASLGLEEEAQLVDFCVDLGTIVGVTTLTWTVASISPSASFDVVVTYNGTDYDSYGQTSSGSIVFNKDSIIETIANISVTAFSGDIVLTLSIGCPVAQILTVIEVVVTSDQDSGETIHTQYRYIDGGYVGPLQTNAVIFQTGTNPVVSRYNTITGAAGSGDIPTEGSTLILGTNKISPDTYDFNPLGNKFSYLRTNGFYPNTPVDIVDLLSASLLATPIVGGPLQYQTSFTVPPNSAGDYLYLIWDLRNSATTQLCYVDSKAGEEELKALCCDCGPCTADCIAITFVALEEEAAIYFPKGLCGEGLPITITLDANEEAEICIVNAEYYITLGDVKIKGSKCDCECKPLCSQYAIWGLVDGGEVSWTNCADGTSSITVGQGDIALICVKPDTTINVDAGDPDILWVNACFCSDCISSCWTWSVSNLTEDNQLFTIKNCNGVETPTTVLAGQKLTFCAFPFAAPEFKLGSLNFNLIDTCQCTI
jgi:hypothetical protein